jgi:hypothetical protein
LCLDQRLWKVKKQWENRDFFLFTLTSHSVTKNIDITNAYQTASISTDPTSSIALDSITDITNSRKHDGAGLVANCPWKFWGVQCPAQKLI